MRYSICLFMVVVCLTLSADEKSPSDSEALSIFEGLAANWEGLDSYDVSLSVKKFSASPTGMFRDQVETYRLMGDFRANRYLFISHGKRRDEGSDDEEAQVLKSTRVFFYDQVLGEAWVRNFPENARRVPASNPQEVLAASRFPDIRLVGCYETLRNFDTRFAIDEVFHAEYHTGKFIKTIESHANESVVRVDDPYGSAGGKTQPAIEVRLGSFSANQHTLCLRYRQKREALETRSTCMERN